MSSRHNSFNCNGFCLWLKYYFYGRLSEVWAASVWAISELLWVANKECNFPRVQHSSGSFRVSETQESISFRNQAKFYFLLILLSPSFRSDNTIHVTSQCVRSKVTIWQWPTSRVSISVNSAAMSFVKGDTRIGYWKKENNTYIYVHSRYILCDVFVFWILRKEQRDWNF